MTPNRPATAGTTAPAPPAPGTTPGDTVPGHAGRPSDQAARDRIRDDTASTLFVDAGAGSGKTTSLIDRVTTLVLRDEISLRHLAAVTFTEKAGAELRDRLRAAFEREYRGATGRRKALAGAALDDLDGAAIGTLHSFAQRILTMHPIEAGLPPLIEVLDEVGSSVAFDNRWAVLQRELLDDEALAAAVRLAFAAGVKLDHVRSLMRAFESDWDLIESHVLHQMPPEIALPDLAGLVAEAQSLAARADECTRDDDKFLPRLAAVAAWAADHGAADEPETVLHALIAARSLSFPRLGLTKSWRTAAGVDSLHEIKDSCKAWQEKAQAAFDALVNASLRPLAHWVAERVRRSARERTAEGRLEFHDLLVVARDLLREHADVRASLQQRYQRLLLDEFQDTDPIQIEIAVRIAGGAAAGAADWTDVDVPAGSLFVVGDPKQSIYRFRRADISLYLRARDHIGTTLTLDASFRTTSPLLAWLNEVFSAVITADEHAQPPYAALTPTRADAAGGPPVVVLGAAPHDDKPTAAQMREREAADVAAVIRRSLDEGWTTYDERHKSWRTLRLGDIAVLVPARTSLPFLEDALDQAGILYRAESSSLVYQAAEVRDLLAAARVVADPSDLLSCVTALRSPLFGCGDDDLWTWKRDRGSFNILAPMPDERAGHPAGRALRYLARLHNESRGMAPSEVLAALIADRRMLEVAAGVPRARDQWRRLRFVVDQARAWSETQHGGLRAYLDWAARQGEETARVAEAVLPETDVDAVRVMTVHAAKGLEFPMVVLSGMSAAPRQLSGVRLLWTASGYAVRLTKSLQTNDFDAVAPLEEQMDAYERRRLLYVAATRARDHLAVSLHRKGTGSTNAEMIADAGGATAAYATVLDPDLQQALPLATPTPHRAETLSWQQWRATIERVRDSSRQVSVRTASGLEGTEPAVMLATEETAAPPGDAKGPRDVELPPWSKGRYGSAIGRAVHGVLQSVDLATGAGLDAAATAQTVAEGVADHADVVRALARSALESDVVRRAAAREHWRETYTGILQDDGTVLEGFIDLVYRDDDGTLVIVDYKTDAIPAAALPARTEHYAPQLAAYERAIRAATGAPVRTTLLFLHPGAAAYASTPISGRTER